MKTIMKLEDLNTIEQLEDFLSDTQAVAFSVSKYPPAKPGALVVNRSKRSD